MPATAAASEIEPPDACAVLRRPAERGQGMVEYAFILVLVAIVVLVAVTALGARTGSLYSNISSGLGT